MSDSTRQLYGPWRSYGFVQRLDKRLSLAKHGRVHYWQPLRPKGEEDEVPTAHVGFEWSHGKMHGRRFRALRLKVSTTGEETLDVAYAVGPVAHYWHLDLDWPRDARCHRLIGAEKGGAPHPMDCKRCGGTGVQRAKRHVRLPLRVRFDVSLELKGVTWCFGPDPMSWERQASWRTRLRRNSLTWWKVSRYRETNEVVDQVLTTIPLPEKAYEATVKLERGVWSWRVGPYSLTRTSKRRLSFFLPFGKQVKYAVDVEIPEGLPHPGKGESSWDCGQDATFGLHAPYGGRVDRDKEWIATAVSSAIESTLRSRLRYGAGIHDTGAVDA